MSWRGRGATSGTVNLFDNSLVRTVECSPGPESIVKTFKAPLMICSVAVLAEETMEKTMDKADSLAASFTVQQCNFSK